MSEKAVPRNHPQTQAYLSPASVEPGAKCMQPPAGAPCKTGEGNFLFKIQAMARDDGGRMSQSIPMPLPPCDAPEEANSCCDKDEPFKNSQLRDSIPKNRHHQLKPNPTNDGSMYCAPPPGR